MKVSISWLAELVDLKVPVEELIRLLPLRTIATKEVTSEFIELDMKGYNRADLLSLRGIAYEVSAITNSTISFKETPDENLIWTNQNLTNINVTIENSDLVSFYCIAKIENLKVEDSNDIWKQKLLTSDMRPVNNITDITNLIMLEYGQPLHAFDAKAVRDGTIVVRAAKKDERVTTLDGKTRDLETGDILITDEQNVLGIAGVMGGKDSEIMSNTQTILLEAAIFNPVSIRSTSTRLGLNSEASKRFQHGLAKKRLFQALDAAIRMYQDLGGKLTVLTIIGEYKNELPKIILTQKKLNSLIGVEIASEQVEGYLKKLHFQVSSRPTVSNSNQVLPSSNGNYSSNEVRSLQNIVWEVIPPYWRLDVNIEEDLIEEVARMYGYEKIPAKPLEGKLPEKIDQKLFSLIGELKKSLVEQGLTEVQTYSFYSTDILNNLNWDKNNLVKIANPISSETEYTREDLWPNLLEIAAKNLKQGFEEIAIFEIGKIYSPQNGEQIRESYRLSLLLINNSGNPIQELHQAFEQVNQKLNLEISLGNHEMGEYEKKYFHPTRFATLNFKGQDIGGIAEVHPRFVNKFGTEKRVAVIEIELQNFLST